MHFSFLKMRKLITFLIAQLDMAIIKSIFYALFELGAHFLHRIVFKSGLKSYKICITGSERKVCGFGGEIEIPPGRFFSQLVVATLLCHGSPVYFV